MKMRSLFYIAALGVISLTMAACKEKGDREAGAPADELYSKSLAILRTYTDSLASAHDSAAVAHIDKEVESRLTHLNYAYPPQTYLEISEGQNDTLTGLTLRFAHLRDSLLYRLAHPLVFRPDSLPADSMVKVKHEADN